MPEQPLAPLTLPALKAHIGDWNYYVTFIRFADAVQRVRAAEDIHTASSLRDLLQRGLRDRAPDIAEYLRHQGQRFFNAIVVGTYGGHPQWHELEVTRPDFLQVEIPDYLNGALGLLVLEGTETLFAIDGQHRIAGMAKAIAEDPEMGKEEIAAIFVRGVAQSERARDPEGFERTRRLFTTLNSRGKPVGKRDIIALDEDDIVAIVTRHLVEDNPLFKDKVDTKGSKSINRSNRVALTTIIALYDALDAYFGDLVQSLPGQKLRRPKDSVLTRFVRDSDRLYAALVRAFPPLQAMQESSPTDEVAGQYRSRQGGHLLFRPVGFIMAHRILRRFRVAGLSVTRAVRLLASAPMMLDDAPWAGLLWDPANRRMITASENQRVAERVLYHGLGGSLAAYKTSAAELRAEWAGLINRPVRSVRLPRFVARP